MSANAVTLLLAMIIIAITFLIYDSRKPYESCKAIQPTPYSESNIEGS